MRWSDGRVIPGPTGSYLPRLTRQQTTRNSPAGALALTNSPSSTAIYSRRQLAASLQAGISSILSHIQPGAKYRR